MSERPGCFDVIFWLSMSLIALQIATGTGPWGKLFTP